MKEWEGLFETILEVLQNNGRAVISIDGRCGSGKTKLAELICNHIPGHILHMDDFYLPMEQRKRDWESIPGGNMDFDRFMSEALYPIISGQSIQYRPYSCKEGCFLKPYEIPCDTLTIVEGSYSQHPQLSKYYDLKIFLTCSDEVQINRIKQREGERYPSFLQRWIPLEDHYFQTFDIKGTCDIRFDTSKYFVTKEN